MIRYLFFLFRFFYFFFLLLTPFFFKDPKRLFISEELEKLWGYWEQVWKIMHAPTKEIENWTPADKKQKRELIKEFGSFFVDIYPETSWHYPIYLHIVVCHLMDMIEEFGSLCRLSNQGFSSFWFFLMLLGFFSILN